MFVYGLGNGLISPLPKRLLTSNAPADLRAGVVSLDRVFQQIAKTLAPTLIGLVRVAADVSAIFWRLGGLSLASIGLAAAWASDGKSGIRILRAVRFDRRASARSRPTVRRRLGDRILAFQAGLRGWGGLV